MINSFMDSLKRKTNFTTTENGATTHKSTLNAVYDLFAFGGSYRNRTDEDCITLFKTAFEEDKELALKCLFYLRDIAEGPGERRFFRVCYRWLGNNYPSIAAQNMKLIVTKGYGRLDDLYCLIDTFVEEEMFKFLKSLIAEDIREIRKEESNHGRSK